jgi:CRISPR system Cascade subunit CasE
MFLSKLLLNPRSSQVWRDISLPYQLHRTILRAFPDAAEGGPGRVLFRVESTQSSDAIILLVQSDNRPDLTRLGVGAGFLLPGDKDGTPRVETKEVRFQVLPRQVLRFRVRANPTKRSKDGQRLGILGETKQLAWLTRKGEAGGFRPIQVNIADEGFRDIGKGKEDKDPPIRMLSVLFEGRLEVTDPARFTQVVEDGLGSGKGFGFGLLSVAPA